MATNASFYDAGAKRLAAWSDKMFGSAESKWDIEPGHMIVAIAVLIGSLAVADAVREGTGYIGMQIQRNAPEA